MPPLRHIAYLTACVLCGRDTAHTAFSHTCLHCGRSRPPRTPDEGWLVLVARAASGVTG